MNALTDAGIYSWKSTDGNLVNYSDSISEEFVTISLDRNYNGFASTGKIKATGSRNGYIDIVDIATDQTIQRLEGHYSAIKYLVFSPDGTILASGAEDGTIKFWNAVDGTILGSVEQYNGVSALSFSLDGKMVASGSEDGVIHIWNTFDGGLVNVIEGHSEPITCFAFSPNGTLLVSGSTGKYYWRDYDENKRFQTLKLWDVFNGKKLADLNTNSYTVYSLTFSPNGEYIASQSEDSKIRIWGIK